MKKEILVIEDNKALRYLLCTLLRKHYKVISVPGAISALQYLRNHPNPDLILLNPDLTDMPDWELPAFLSSSFYYSSIPLVVISSERIEKLRHHGRKYHIAACFRKPFDPVVLMEAVDNLVVGNSISMSV